MTSRCIKTESELDGLFRFLRNHPLPITVTILKGAHRTNQQSRTVEKWYSQIAKEYGMPQNEAKAECKLRFGLPIMKRDNPKWIEEWQPIYSPFPYEKRLKLFEIIPLTSKFVTRQMTEYMDAVQKEYRGQGIDLIDPEAMKYQ